MKPDLKKLLPACILFSLLFFDAMSQNVGIGTATPQYKLDVNGRMRVKTGTLNNVSTSSGIWFEDYRTGTDRIFVGMQDSIRAGFYGSGTGGAGWEFNFNALTGAVGIGRNATSNRLEIADVNGGAIALYSGVNFAGRIRATDTSMQIFAGYGSTFCIPDPCAAKDLILLPPPDNIFNGQFIGRVGIGTNAPTARLHLTGNMMIGGGNPADGYLLSVNGKIVSEELKVQLNTNWPDYVFNNDYRLASIDEMKSFIESNKHLKNIPSAKQVETDGILVGDMQKRMMEKIEELSLYIIQLHERIKQLEQNQQK